MDAFEIMIRNHGVMKRLHEAYLALRSRALQRLNQAALICCICNHGRDCSKLHK